MEPRPATDLSPARKKLSRKPTMILSLDHDIICMIFAFLDVFDLVRCSAVCKFWKFVVRNSKLLHQFYFKLQLPQNSTGLGNPPMSLEKPLGIYLEELAMERHRMSLQYSVIQVDQWRGHSARVGQCRMKMGLILTGVGDKVMRLWSLDGYKCINEYTIPNAAPLIDYDFDESKVVGLIGTRICIWRENGKKNIFPSQEGTFTKGLCLRYFDPDAVIGCEDGTARVFDMYSRKCSRIIRMHSAPVTCLCVTDDQLILSGSSLGSIAVSDSSSDQPVATLRSNDRTGIKTLSFNPRSQLVFAGSTAGCASCWDLRTMKPLWETRVSPNVIYSMQHLQNDSSTLVVGGIDGVMRMLSQNTGEVLSRCVAEAQVSSPSRTSELVEKRKGRRLSEDACIDSIPRTARPPITCLAVGMKKVVTTHNSKYIRLWKFD